MFLRVLSHAVLRVLPRLPQTDALAPAAHTGRPQRGDQQRQITGDDLVTARRRLCKGKGTTPHSILSRVLLVYYSVFAVGLGIYISMV